MTRTGFSIILTLVLTFTSFYLWAQSSDDSLKNVNVRYGSNGFEFQTLDNKFLLQIQSRLQFRFATPGDQNPLTFDDFTDDRKRVLKINRARLKVGGHAFQPWLKYYWEYELAQSNLLDFRIMIEKWKALNFKLGQWKVEFTRERFISSGEQQMVERSIINRPFTVDRQQGVTVYGNLKGNGLLDFNYWVAALTGTGRGNVQNDDSNLMYFGRWQWNFFGRPLEFEGGDLEIHEKPTGIIALAAVTNRSPYTRFSQAGGGSLEGFENGEDGQYRVNQFNFETAFMYKGFSWQSEVHRKEIIDKLNDDETTLLSGYYVQSGYFFHQLISWWPAPLELAVRHASYRPDVSFENNRQDETSIAANWFFNGHRNKLTMESTYFSFQDENLNLANGWRFRLQWDISL